METNQTPWGIALNMELLGEGILWVETAEHGGLLIERGLAGALFSSQALEIGRPWQGFLAFEQEYDMPVIFYEHPELYPWIEEKLTEQLACDCLQLTHPEYFQL